MKIKSLLTILTIFVFFICISCNSCTSSAAQENAIKGEQDTIDNVEMAPDTISMSITMTSPNMEDTVTVILKKEIKKMEMDTTIKINKTEEFEKLEKIEKILKEQSETIDSILKIRNK